MIGEKIGVLLAEQHALARTRELVHVHEIDLQVVGEGVAGCLHEVAGVRQDLSRRSQGRVSKEGLAFWNQASRPGVDDVAVDVGIESAPEAPGRVEVRVRGDAEGRIAVSIQCLRERFRGPRK